MWISSYSFTPFTLKLYMCLDHGLKMCILFGHTPQIIFVTFFINRNIFVAKVNIY